MNKQSGGREMELFGKSQKNLSDGSKGQLGPSNDSNRIPTKVSLAAPGASTVNSALYMKTQNMRDNEVYQQYFKKDPEQTDK